MGAALVALAGTPAGEALALGLALLSALAHAVFGAINKGGRDPYLNRGAINLAYGAMAAPVALFVTPWPSPALWAALAAAWAAHLVYEWLQARSYAMGGFTVVYPIARGAGPLVTVVAAGIVFGERFAPLQWAGLMTLTAGVWGLAWANLRALGPADVAAARRLRGAILTALATGVMIAVYTTLDAWGIRQADDPFTFLAWFFTLGGAGFPLVAAARWRRLPRAARPDPRGLVLRGAAGALAALVSFGAAMLATRVGQVGEAAAIRETSIVFAAAIGVTVFGERLDARRLGLIGAIAFGAALVSVG